jgi:hypothetical protein
MRAGVIIVAENRPEALARLDVFVGEWEHDFALTYRQIG